MSLMHRTAANWALRALVLTFIMVWVRTLVAATPPLTMVVMDPLAAPLSCPCVAGFAQRDYEQLAEFLEVRLGCEVTLSFCESLRLEGKRLRQADIVIGKRSVVEADSRSLTSDREPIYHPVASLTDRDGSPWQQGLVVVHRDDPALRIEDLREHRLHLGPEDCAEKHAAARRLFQKHGLNIAADAPISTACSDGATAVIEAAQTGGPPAATVISSYAQPLLEGCGTIKRGDLRVIARTENVPFITAFLANKLSATRRTALTKALLAVGDEPLLRLALETKQGFIQLASPTGKIPIESDQSRVAPKRMNGDWPGWRGPKRNGQVAWLPETLPTHKAQRWRGTLFAEGVGGVAVADGVVVVGDRDLADERDVFHAFEASTGERLWMFDYPAAGHLDYGNSPRATPLLVAGYAYLLGAFGQLHCCHLRTGQLVWKRHIREEFQATDELGWGVASSPLIVEGRLIINPGGPKAAVVALDPRTGKTLWQTAGQPAAFASFVYGELQGRRQLVGFDKLSCGGWDLVNGQRLWTYTAKVPGDFNVPTPLLLAEGVLLASENNGLRLLGFASPTPVVAASFTRLKPDMHTPIATAGRIFAVHDGRIVCLEARSLQLLWSAFDRSLKGHVSMVAADDRVLLQTQQGELLIIDAQADELKILSRSHVFRREVSTYAHPAVAGDAIFVRGPGKLICLPL